jgi:hypothetical protein
MVRPAEPDPDQLNHGPLKHSTVRPDYYPGWAGLPDRLNSPDEPDTGWAQPDRLAPKMNTVPARARQHINQV